MEKKIKTLYILSIAAIIAFLGMQAYWLYNRYEYSITEYENVSEEIISNAILEYNNRKSKYSNTTKEVTKVQSSYQMQTNVDSAGNRRRIVTVTTKEINGRKLLGIAEKRDLTPDEQKRLQEIIMDSLEIAEAKIATVDASTAPSDGIAWNAMRNFENEMLYPFSAEEIDSVLRKKNLTAEATLILQDSVTWEPVTVRHSSVFSPSFKVITPYSELERKAVVIECKIPASEVLREMGWTLLLAVVLSMFLILCLVWQIRTIAKLTRLDKMRNSFITTMIHELKRPISTLKMCVSGIDNDKLMEDPQMRHELTSETRIALDNLSAYFSKLRDITFNDVEQIPLNVTSFNLHALVEGVLKSIVIPGGKTAEFENRVPVDLEISADRSHLMNILTNLTENAIKYSGDEVSVKFYAETTANGVSLKVSDNGNGISSADKNKIFNRFYRGKAFSADIPGMGLGLAYVKLLTEAHGGIISVESEENVGSTFHIILPQ